MRLAGPLADRFGTRRAVPASAALCCGTLILPGLAAGPWSLGAALLALGFGNGCLDVCMNTHAVQVERGYRRPIMSAFHAVFSIGGVLAALAGARTLSWGWSTPLTLGLVAALGLAVTVIAAWPLLGLAPDPVSTGRSDAGRSGAGPASAVPGSRYRVSRRIWALAGLTLLLMLCEGVAYDWSVLDLRDVLGAPVAVAALGYGAFSIAMTIGRLLADRVASRFGPVAVVRYGALIAATALGTVAVAPWTALAMTGWAVFGIGLSGCVPQLFSAAGHADPAASGANVSRVAGLGYLGVLAGPAIIGPMTKIMPLNLAFLLPAACCVLAASAADLLRPAAGSLARVHEPGDLGGEGVSAA